MDAAEAQTFFDSLPNGIFFSDPMLKNFKKADIDASVRAAATGKFYEYWTVDKIAELNNTVDANPSCPADLKGIFGVNASKNPRIKSKKIGDLILQYLGELSKSGVSASATAEADTAPVQSMSSSQSFSAPPPLPTAESSSRLTFEPQNMVYKFASDLPPDCQLRVRSGPSTEATLLGVVTADDEIVCVGKLGEWIKVRLDACPAPEAWMLSATPDRVLLFPAGAPAQAPEKAPEPVRYEQQQQQQPPQQQSFAPQQSVTYNPPAAPQITPSQSMAQVQLQGLVQQLSQAQPFNQQQQQQQQFQPNPPFAQLTQSWAPGASPSRPTSAIRRQETVSFEAYQYLEARVLALEAELYQLKQHLRNI